MKIVDAQVHIWRQTVSQPTGKHRKVSLVSAEQMLKEMDEAGVDAAGLARLMSPIGIDIGSRTPEETAVSIVAEIIALRTGRHAPSLRASFPRTRSIHTVRRGAGEAAAFVGAATTAQDLARGKPSEIDHLNGYVVARGKTVGVATPVNRALLVLLKLVERCEACT